MNPGCKALRRLAAGHAWEPETRRLRERSRQLDAASSATASRRRARRPCGQVHPQASRAAQPEVQAHEPGPVTAEGLTALRATRALSRKKRYGLFCPATLPRQSIQRGRSPREPRASLPAYSPERSGKPPRNSPEDTLGARPASPDLRDTPQSPRRRRPHSRVRDESLPGGLKAAAEIGL